MKTKGYINQKQKNHGLKTKINAWLERMARANEEQFGHKRMDCCNLKKS